MKEVIKFFIFILLSSSIFFIPNNYFIIFFIIITTFIALILTKLNFKVILNKFLIILPFIIFTFLFNVLLDDLQNAIFVFLKLIIVLIITLIYSNLTSISKFTEVIDILCRPLSKFGISNNDIDILIAITFSILPIMKNELTEIKESCIAKNIKLNIKNVNLIFSKYFISLFKKINELEEALISKGY